MDYKFSQSPQQESLLMVILGKCKKYMMNISSTSGLLVYYLDSLFQMQVPGGKAGRGWCAYNFTCHGDHCYHQCHHWHHHQVIIDIILNAIIDITITYSQKEKFTQITCPNGLIDKNPSRIKMWKPKTTANSPGKLSNPIK